LTNNIKLSSDKGQTTGLIFVDFQKAFDTINPQRLLMKMKQMGIGYKLVQSLIAISQIEQLLFKTAEAIQMQTPFSEEFPKEVHYLDLYFHYYY